MKTKVILFLALGALAFVQVAAEDEKEARNESEESDESDEDGDSLSEVKLAGNEGVKNLAGSRVANADSPPVPIAPKVEPSNNRPAKPANRFFACFSSHACSSAWGKCKAHCGTNERLIWHGCHGLGCVCCAPIGCTVLQDCRDKWGTCRKWCETGERELKGGCIGGGNCKCCYRETPVQLCKIRPNCQAEGGVCRSTGCLPNEKDIPWGCEGNGCWCCVPKEPECELLGKCSLQKGTCKKECEKWETYVDKGCYGTECKCCVPKDQKCKISEKCLSRGGECKDYCSDHEKEIPYGCHPTKKGSKDVCKCCAPRKCVRNQKCGRYDGKCKKWCESSYEFEVPGGCYGTGTKKCRCCSKKGCHMTKQCRRHGGWCENRKCTGKDEVEVPYGCLGYGKCYCCAPAYKAADIAADTDITDYKEYNFYDEPADYYQTA